MHSNKQQVPVNKSKRENNMLVIQLHDDDACIAQYIATGCEAKNVLNMLKPAWNGRWCSGGMGATGLLPDGVGVSSKAA